LEQPITDKPAEPVLPQAQDLSASEYRAHRDGKPIAEIVSARTLESVAEPPVEEKPEPIRERDAQGRFIEPVKAKQGQPPEENKRYNPKVKIDELTANWRTAERERDELKARLEALERPAPASKVAPQAAPAAPQPETFTFPDFDTWTAQHPDATGDVYAQWMRASIKAEDKFEREQEAAKEKQSQTQTQRQTALKTFHERHAKFVAEHADFQELVKTSPIAAIVPPIWINEVIIESEHGPLLQYHLLQHPDEFHAIVNLPERAAVLALGKLEARLTAASTGPAADVKPQTQADAPLEPVGASASTASSRSLETVAKQGSASDYRRLRESGVKV
jgi:hypothetical protein